jgi:hypothetical protein
MASPVEFTVTSTAGASGEACTTLTRAMSPPGSELSSVRTSGSKGWSAMSPISPTAATV